MFCKRVNINDKVSCEFKHLFSIFYISVFFFKSLKKKFNSELVTACTSVSPLGPKKVHVNHQNRHPNYFHCLFWCFVGIK